MEPPRKTTRPFPVDSKTNLEFFMLPRCSKKKGAEAFSAREELVRLLVIKARKAHSFGMVKILLFIVH